MSDALDLPSFSHADNDATELRARATSHPSLPAIVNAVRAATAAMNAADDVTDVMQATVSLIDAYTDLEIAAKQAKEIARAALTWCMEETGATTIKTEHRVASLSEADRVAVITDPDMIPAEYWRQPDPAPDKAAIKRALKVSADAVPGAVLSNGGTSIVTIRSRK